MTVTPSVLLCVFPLLKSRSLTPPSRRPPTPPHTVTGQAYENLVSEIMSMGYERQQVVAALEGQLQQPGPRGGVSSHGEVTHKHRRRRGVPPPPALTNANNALTYAIHVGGRWLLLDVGGGVAKASKLHLLFYCRVI